MGDGQGCAFLHLNASDTPRLPVALLPRETSKRVRFQVLRQWSASPGTARQLSRAGDSSITTIANRATESTLEGMVRSREDCRSSPPISWCTLDIIPKIKSLHGSSSGFRVLRCLHLNLASPMPTFAISSSSCVCCQIRVPKTAKSDHLEFLFLASRPA